MEYKVVDGIIDFEKKVNLFAKSGWRIVGGTYFESRHPETDEIISTVIMQKA